MIGPAERIRARSPAEREKNNYYLPGKDQSQMVSVSTAGEAQAEIIVLTEAIAMKETGPKETIAKFGEVYGFAPSFIAVHKDEPTRLTFWNLQPDDDHDFMLADPDLNVLMHVKLHAAVEKLVGLQLPQGRHLPVLLRGASARDERADPRAAGEEVASRFAR